MADRAAGSARLALVSNALDGPPDEGTRKVVQTLARAMPDATAVSVDDAAGSRAEKLLFSRAAEQVRRAGARVVVYVPTQGLTAATFVRMRRLRSAGRCKVVLIATQGRPPVPGEKLWARSAGPDVLLSPSSAVVDHALSLGIDARFVPLGVDTATFVPVDAQTKTRLRSELGFGERPLLLHVGHASANRNLGWLTRARAETGADVVLVVGRSQGVDEALLESLRGDGVRVVSDFVPDIAKVYAAADCYVFPVLAEQGAIGIPLSVLEAMACNLPVVSTPFGGLPRMFAPEGGLFFASGPDEWTAAVGRALDLPNGDIGTRRLVEPYSWDAFAERVVDTALSL